MKRRSFLKTTAAGTLAFALPFQASAFAPGKKLRVAQVGLGMMGVNDLCDIASHPAVDVVALCDVDAIKLKSAGAGYANAKTFTDYREMFKSMGGEIDAVIVST